MSLRSALLTLRTTTTRYAATAYRQAKAHKVISIIVLIVVLFGGYKAYAAYAAKTTTTQYSLATATKEPIAVTVTGSGQVASEHELSLSPKASGTLTSVTVKAGDQVHAGQVIATVDATDAQKTLRDARTSLESARISYQTAIMNANDTSSNNETSLESARDAGFDAAAKNFSDLPTLMTGLKSILYDTSSLSDYVTLTQDYDPSIVIKRTEVDASYDAALASYNQTFAAYQAASRTSSPADIATLLDQTADADTKVNQAVKDSLAFMTEAQTTITAHNGIKVPTALAGQITTLTGYTNTISSDASSIRSSDTSLTNAQQDLSQSQASVNGGSTSLSIESAQISLQKAEDSYDDAVTSLADYSVTAPFAGTIGSVALQKFDQAGGSTAVATLITDEQFVDLSLNETDIASIQVGQPVDLTFDALEGVTATGTVAEVNQVGTVSQGVATYTVKVGFASTDTRIKPGMTAEATITTASKQDALTIPLTALKSRTVGGQTQYYVQVPAGAAGSTTPRTASSTERAFAPRSATSSSTAPGIASSSAARAARTGGAYGARATATAAVGTVTLREIPVTIGIQNDTSVEITNGLTEGAQVVSGTLNASGQATTASKGLFSLFGGGSKTSTTARTAGGTASARTGASFGGGATRAGGATGGAPGGF